MTEGPSDIIRLTLNMRLGFRVLACQDEVCECVQKGEKKIMTEGPSGIIQLILNMRLRV